MVNFIVPQIRELMDKPDNIRNTTIIAHMKHGKSTISDSLVAKAGIVIYNQYEDARYTDSRCSEQERRVTVKPTSSPLYYEHITSEKEKKDAYLINLIDSPGHIDFLSEVTAALRITDGALVIVDCIEGVCMQTEAVLRVAMIEKVKPILMINKLDTQILELQTDAEEMYKNFSKIIESANTVVSNYAQADMGDALFYPGKANVAFGSGKECWAFTLTTFAQIYSKKFKIDLEKIREKLWGDNYYDPQSRKWFKDSTNEEGEPLSRAFCAFIMEPIIKLSRSIMDGNTEQMNKILASIEISLSSEEKELNGRKLLKLIMSKWLNISDTLLEMMMLHLPSPKVAQQYRVNYLYEGPQDDEIAASFRDCNPKGPLIMYVSKLVPTSIRRFYAFGRIFGGTIQAGQKVRIMGPNYKHGKKDDLYEKSIQRTILMIDKNIEEISDVPCGNLVGLVGIDQYLVKTGTISDDERSHCIKSMKFSVAPVVQVAVEPKNLADLPRFIEGLRMLSKFDPLVMASSEENGQHLIAGSSELHIEVCLNDLRNEYANCEIKSSDPFVTYKETVTTPSKQVCFTKSANKHNKFYATAEPLVDELADLIDSRKLGPKDDIKEKQKVLCGDFRWDKTDAERVWAFGPDQQGANILVDATKGVQYMNEVKDSMISAFQWATKEGVMTDESMRSVRINIVDVYMMVDAIHRGDGQVIPAARRVYCAAELTAEPRMQEPIFLTEITFPADTKSSVYKCLNERRGVIIEEEPISGVPLIKIKAYLPVAESFGNFVVNLICNNPFLF